MMETIEPTEEGLVERAGATIHYQVYGEAADPDAPTLVFAPAFNIVSAGTLYRSQIPMLSRRHRCVIFDALGTGGSSRTSDPRRVSIDQWVADLVAVVDAVGVERFITVGQSLGGVVALLTAAAVPERVLGVVGIAAATMWDDDRPRSEWDASFEEIRESYVGWEHWNAHAILTDYEKFLRFFLTEAGHRVHPEADIARMVELALAESDAETVVAFIRTTLAGANPEGLEAALTAVRCPVLLLHGDDDRTVPLRYTERTAEVLGIQPVILSEGAHDLATRRSPEVNHAIDEWLEDFRPEPAVPSPPSRARTSTGPRILYLSSPIGLGHVRRDLAIADEIRTRVPDVEIDWLTQDPATSVLSERGESVHPAARLLASENDHMNRHASDHGLNAARALTTMDEILSTNFFVFQDVLTEGKYDLVIGDEAWEVDGFWLDNPSAKRTRYAWLTDFVGELALPEHGTEAATLSRARNARMLQNIEDHPDVRDLSLFVGTPEDIVDDAFGAGLDAIRPWTAEHFDFSGYITGFEPGSLPPQDELRDRFGVGADEIVVTAAVGGSGIGGSLLHAVVAAHQRLHARRPNLRTIVVAGPRISTDRFPDVPGLDVRGWVPDLHHLLAASDAAVVQGGLTTTMELTAAGIPFLYAPLDGHFEQQRHVHHRLRRHRAGIRISHDVDSDELAELIDRLIGDPTDYEPVPTDGAANAASRLIALL